MDLDDACRQQRTAHVLALLARKSEHIRLTHTLLEFAATSSDVRVLRAVLNHGGNPNFEIHKGKTLLFFAMEQRHTDKVKLLLDSRADLSRPIDEREMLPLHYACVARLGLAELLVERKANVNATSAFKHGATPLMLACGAKQADVVQLLVHLNADVHAADHDDCTALHHACKAGDNDLAHWLVNVLGLNARHVVSSGETALHHAVAACNARLVEFLIHQGCSVHETDGGGKTPLAIAAMYDDGRRAPIVQMLLSHCANVDAATVAGMTPLHFACRAGHFHAAKLLVDAGGDVDARGPDGCTGLFYAAKNKDLKIARLLMDSGCDLRVRVEGFSVLRHAVVESCPNFAALLGEYQRRGVAWEGDLLHVACKKSNRGAIAALLRAGVDVNTRDARFTTALQHAVQGKDLPSVRMLLRAGADTEGALLACFQTRNFPEWEECAEMIVQHGGDVNGNVGGSLSMLCWVVDQCSVKDFQPSIFKFVDFLLKHGAHVQHTVTWHEEAKNTALHIAVWHGKCQDVVARLLEAGADVHAVNARGRTPLFSAILGSVSLCFLEMLFKHGAQIQLQDNKGRTPLLLAVLVLNVDIVRWCIEKVTPGAIARDQEGRSPLDMLEMWGDDVPEKQEFSAVLFRAECEEKMVALMLGLRPGQGEGSLVRRLNEDMWKMVWGEVLRV